MPKFDVLVLSEINADLILGHNATPVFGQAEKLIDDATLTMGSSGVIFACGAARLGLRVGICGIVGDDIFGRYMLESIRERGIDTTGVIVDPQQKTGFSVILNEPDDRAILTHLGAINSLSADLVDRSLLSSTRHLHITSYYLQHQLQPDLPDLLSQARAFGATVSMDTNWDPDEEWDSSLDQALEYTDLFLPNLNEALAISRASSLESAIEILADKTGIVATKLGADGAICRRDSVTVRDPGFPVDVVDTTGAGDSFDAGFVYGYINGWSMADALALGCACGSLSTRSTGGASAQPTLYEAETLIKTRNAITAPPNE